MAYDPNSPGSGSDAPNGGQPQYGGPQYGQPQYGQPQYGQPQYGQPNGGPQYGQPQYGQPQYGQPQYGQPNGGPGSALPPNMGNPSSMLGMKPGIIPLRPLTMGEILDGAFQAIRRNAKITLGLTLAIVSIAITIFTALGLVLLPWISRTFGGWATATGEEDLSIGSMSLTDLNAITTASSIGMALATIVVTGTLVYAIGQLCLGIKPSAGEIWRKVKSRIWALLGVTVLTSLIVTVIVAIPVGFVMVGAEVSSTGAVVFGVLLGIVAILAVIVVSIMLSLAPAALILEEASVMTSLKRSWLLVKSQFWRIVGIQLLLYLIVSVLQQIIMVPLMLIGTIVGASMASSAIVLVGMTLATILGATIGVCYSASVIALLYIDVRMRREGLDMQLAAKASSS